MVGITHAIISGAFDRIADKNLIIARLQHIGGFVASGAGIVIACHIADGEGEG